MAISFKKQYTSEAEYAYDLASSTNRLFNKDDYYALADKGLGVDYSMILADMVNKTSDTFDLTDYNLLSDSIDKLTYLITHYYTPKDATDIDETTGETYNVFERNNEYLNHKIQEQIDKNTYESLGFWGKLGASVVGFVGNAFTQLYGLVENLLDVGAFIGEGGLRLRAAITGSEEDVKTAEIVRKWALRDFTGAGAAQKAIDDFNHKYTVWDKSAVAKAIIDVESAIVRMAPLIISGVFTGGATWWGTALYYGAMAGQEYSNTIERNPDVNYGNLLLYVGGSVALEAGTEYVSGKIFGGDTISKMIFGGNGKARTAFKALGMDMFTEGLEEATSELFGSLLYKAIIDPNAEVAGFDDILYAAVLGALTGGVMTGGSVMTTTRWGVTEDGKLVTKKYAKDNNLKIKKLDAVKSFNVSEALSAGINTEISEVQKLKNKYNADLDTIQKEHAEEYKKAVEKDKKQNKTIAESALKIAKFLETIGVEKFKKASSLLENNMNDAIKLVENWQNHQKGTNNLQNAALVELEKLNPGTTFNINETLTAEEKALAKVLKEAYGVELFVGEFGNSEGQRTFDELVMSPNFVFLENGAMAKEGYNTILEKYVAKQLVNKLLSDPNVLTDKHFQKFLKIIAPNMKEGEKLTKEVKSSIASMLLFDEISINKVFYSDSNLFVKIARWAKNAITKNRSQKKSQINKIEFNKLLKIRDRYVKTVGNSIGNDEDVEKAKTTMDLTVEELEKLTSLMKRNVTNHILLMNNDLSLRSVEFKTAQLKLVNSKADGEVDTDIDYNEIYNTDYWTEEFVNEVTTFYPDYNFSDALDYYCMDKLGFILSQRNQSMYKVVNMAEAETVSKEDFLMDIDDAVLTNDVSLITKYTKPSDIFTEDFLSVFNAQDLSKITIKYDQLANKQGETFVDDNGNITITINSADIHNAQKVLYHELAHALGKIMGFPNGTSKNAMLRVADSLSEDRLRLLATKMFGAKYVENATRIELVAEVGAELYAQNEGERYANGDPTKFTREFDGFRIYNGYVFGLGKYEYIFPGMKLMFKIPEGVETRESAYEPVSVKHSKEIGVTLENAKEQGFSEEFIELLEKEDLTLDSMWELINRNAVGNTQATNKIIQYLAPDNKSMKTMEDVERAKTLGIAYASVYGKAQLAKNPEYNKKSRPSYDKLNAYFENRPQLINKVNKENEKIAKHLDRAENSTINSWLIKKDYGYSLNQTEKLLLSLRGEHGLSSDKKVLRDTTEVSTKGEEGQVSKTDMVDYENWITNQTEETIAKETYSSVDNYIKTINDAVEKLGDSEQLFQLRNKIKNDRSMLIKSFGEEGYNKILSAAPKTKESYNQRIRNAKITLSKYKLTNDEAAIVQQNHREFSKPSEFESYIEKLTEIKEKYAKKSVEEAILKSPDEEKVVEKKTVSDEKKIVSKEKQITQTEKKETPAETKKPKFKEKPVLMGNTTDDIVFSILEPFRTAATAESQTQYSEATNKEYTKVSYNMIDELSAVLIAVNDSNYDEIRDKLKTSDEKFSDQALMIFDLYTWEMRHRYSPETVTKIENNSTKEKSLAGQQLALQSSRVKERNPASEIIGVLKNKGLEVSIEDDLVIKYKEELKNKEEYINKLNEKIKKLEQQIKENKNELEVSELNRELKETSQEKFVMENGTNEDIMNWIITHAETLNQASKITDDLLNRLIETARQAEDKNKGVKTILYDKKGNPIPFPKAREMIFKSLKATKSYRMWAMLSSPVTWARNWIGNKGMQALDSATNFFERLISSHMNFGVGQLKYNDTRAGKEVYDHIGEVYGDYITALINGEAGKYEDVAEIQKAAKIKRELLKKQAEESTGFKKLLAQIQNLQQWGLETGPLGDHPMLFASICKNMGNLVASNSEYLLGGMKKEIETLNKKKDLSEAQKARLLLLNRAVQSKNASDIFDAMSNDEMERFFDVAKEMSFEQYFKNENLFSRWCAELGKKSPILGEIVSWIMPFPKVAGNVLKMAFRYSPFNVINVLKNWSVVKQVTKTNEKGELTFKGRITGFETAKLVKSISETSVGTLMVIAGAIAAALGWINIDEDDYMGPSLKIGDLKISLSNLAPTLTTFSTAAAVMWAFKNDKNPITQGLSTLYDNTLLGNIDNILSYGSSEKFIENITISYLGQYIPAVVKLVNKWTTNSAAKDKTGPFLSKAVKTLGSYVPGISSLVPDKINPYTGEKAYSTNTDNWFYNFLFSISPLTVKSTNKTALEAEAELYEAETTGLSGSFKINGKDVSVSGKTKENLAKYRAEYIKTQYEKITSGKLLVTVEDKNGKRITTKYSKLTDEQKSKVLKNLYSSATDITKIKYWLDQGNYYIVTDTAKLSEYKKLFNSSRIIYKKSWSKSKFVEK